MTMTTMIALTTTRPSSRRRIRRRTEHSPGLLGMMTVMTMASMMMISMMSLRTFGSDAARVTMVDGFAAFGHTKRSHFSLSQSSSSSSSFPSPPSSSSSSTSLSSSPPSPSPDILPLLMAPSQSSQDSQSPWAPALWSLRLNFFGLDDNSNRNPNDDTGKDKNDIRLAVSGVVLISSNDVKISDLLTTGVRSDNNKMNSRNNEIVEMFFNGRSTLSHIRTVTNEECQLLLGCEHFRQNPAATSLLSKQRPFGYVNQYGQQELFIERLGGWTIDFPPSSSSSSTTSSSSSSRKNGKASTLRMCLTVNNENDVERSGIKILPAQSRLLLSGNVWRETALDVGQQQIRPIVDAARLAQRRLDEQLSHESGDRRLDGVDLGQTIAAFGDMASLVWKRDETRSKLQEALRVYPPVDNDNDYNDGYNNGYDSNTEYLPEGPWPGDNEWLSISNAGADLNPIYMCHLTQQDEIRLVGTWSAEPILPEGVYVEVD